MKKNTLSLVAVFAAAIVAAGAMALTAAAAGTEYVTRAFNSSDTLCEITSVTTDETAVIVPDTISGKTVAAIGKNAFDGCSTITSLTLPRAMTTIGDFAFSDCTELTSSAIPNSVLNLGRFAYSGCGALTSVTIGTGITSIPLGCFNATGLTSVAVPEGVAKIETGAFANSAALSEVTLPSTLTEIGGAAFQNTALTQITVPDSVTSIGVHALGYNYNLVVFTKVSDFTIYCSEGSAAAAYADANGFTKVTKKNIANATVAPIAEQKYEGSAVCPTLTVSYDGTPLVMDTDYTVVYSDNEAAGTGKALITGIGNYAGTKTVEFAITTDSARKGMVTEGDDTIDSGDALLCLKHSVGMLTLEGDAFGNADVNNDGIVNSADALIILRYSVGIITTLG